MTRILVIDDDPSVCSFLRRGLSLEGFAVEAALEGAKGLELAESFAPDLVILDRMLTGMSGLDVLARLRGAMPETPVVMFSGRDPLPGGEVELGVDAYLLKPVKFDELVTTVNSLLVKGR